MVVENMDIIWIEGFLEVNLFSIYLREASTSGCFSGNEILDMPTYTFIAFPPQERNNVYI